MLLETSKEVFKRKRYVILAVGTGITIFVFAVIFPNIKLAGQIIPDTTIPLLEKISLFINLLGSITTNFTVLSASYTILIAVLFGANIAIITFYLKNRIAAVKQGGMATGILGMASGVLGLGCAACGSIIISLILPLFGGGALLALLPLQGSEFGILGVILLSISYYLTIRQIHNPAVCKIS